MPSILLPEVIKQQAKLERQLARQRRGEVGCEGKDFVVEWLTKQTEEDPASYEVWSYQEFYDHLREEVFPNTPPQVWEYFNLDCYMYDLATSGGDYVLVYYDPSNSVVEERIFTIGQVGDVHPAWKYKAFSWFNDHPAKDRFYLLKHDD